MVKFIAGKRLLSYPKYPDWFWDPPSHDPVVKGLSSLGMNLNISV
jgi:hypothetical protein